MIEKRMVVRRSVCNLPFR